MTSIYIMLAIGFYIYNRNMGPWWTGVIAYSFWFVIPPMWILGLIFEMLDEHNIKKRMQEDAKIYRSLSTKTQV